MCSIEDCGLENFEDSNKCILHCEKDNFVDNYIFVEELKKILEKPIRDIEDQRKRIKSNRVSHFNKEWSLSYDNIHFPKNVDIFYFDWILEYNSYFENSVFYGEVKKGSYTEFEFQLEFVGCTFKNKVDLSRATFLENINFKSCVFENELKLENTIFKNNVFFQKSNFKKEVDFEDTIFMQSFSFFGVNKDVKVKNRETARIIKDSLEQEHNIIEANKYYALEMKAREKELTWKNDLFDWLVFKVHGIASNHSQDWFLALLWIICFGMIKTIYDTNISIILLGFMFCSLFLYEKISKVMFLIPFFLYTFFMWSIDKNPFDELAKTINPFDILKSNSDISFFNLIFKLGIAYLIYQFIVSIRQNTRRK